MKWSTLIILIAKEQSETFEMSLLFKWKTNLNLSHCCFTGYYAYLMSRRSSQTAVLQSPVLNDTGCLEFWYALNAIPKSFLNLKITHLDGNEASMWRQYGTGRTLGSRVKWLKASLPIYTGGIHKYQVRCYCIEVACLFDRVGQS